MLQIEWQSKPVSDITMPGFADSFKDGKIYTFIYNGKEGTVLGRTLHKFRRNQICIYAVGGEKEIILRKEGNFFNSQENLYTVGKEEKLNAGIEYNSFFLNGDFYNTHFKQAGIFSKNKGNDINIEIYKVYTSILMRIIGNRVPQQWWNYSFIKEEICGTIEMEDDPGIEIILLFFIYFHLRLERMAISD